MSSPHFGESRCYILPAVTGLYERTVTFVKNWEDARSEYFTDLAFKLPS